MGKQSVYFALAERSNRVKIGYAKNVFKRIRVLQTGCPERIKLILIFVGYGRGMEKLLHERFSRYRVSGEWFVYSQSIQQFVKFTKQNRRDNAEEEEYERRIEKEYEKYMEQEEQRYMDECEEQRYQESLQEQEVGNAEEDS